MADRTQRLAIIVTAQDLAHGKLGKVRAELAQMGTAGRIASVGLGGVMLAGNKAGQAFGHLKGRLTSLAGPLGLIGLSAGIFSVTGAFASGVEKATTWGLAIEKLTGLTSNSAEQLSGLLGLTEKFGITNERITQIVGFTEKALGKLQEKTIETGTSAGTLRTAQDDVTKAHERLTVATLRLAEIRAKGGASDSALAGARYRVRDATLALHAAETKLATVKGQGAAVGITGAVALQKQYGVVLTDSKGRALDFQAVLLNVADAYAKATSAADKARVAALSATVFGRGYADLIPILELGRQGILDAEQAAKDLGLTLTSGNVADLAKYREAMRQASDATSGLELQLGLLVMPDLTTAFARFVEFMRTHQSEAKAFFTGALHTAEGFVGFVTGTVIPTVQSMVGSARDAWEKLPAPLRDFMVKGFVADRTIKFLFGMSPIEFAGKGLASALGGALGGLFARGATPATPLFVSDVTGGLKGVGSLAEGAAAAGGIGLLTVALSAVTIAAIGVAFVSAMQQAPDIVPRDRGGTQGQVFSPGHGFGPRQFGPGGTREGTWGKAIDDATLSLTRNSLTTDHAGKAIDDLAIASGSLARAIRSEYEARRRLYALEKTTLHGRGRLAILARGDKADALLVGETLAAKFTHSQAPWYRSAKNQERALVGLEALQKRFASVGDTKSAAAIGRDIRAIRSFKPTPASKIAVTVHTVVSLAAQITTSARDEAAQIYRIQRSTSASFRGI